jgi:hypothetical protein
MPTAPLLLSPTALAQLHAETERLRAALEVSDGALAIAMQRLALLESAEPCCCGDCHRDDESHYDVPRRGLGAR